MNNKTSKNQSGNGSDADSIRFLNAASIIGNKIEDNQEETIGSVADMMVSVESGKIEFIVIESGGFLSMGEKYFAVPFCLLKLDEENQKLILNQRKEIFELAPGFDEDHWPETNIQLFDAANTYWSGYMGEYKN